MHGRVGSSSEDQKLNNCRRNFQVNGRIALISSHRIAMQPQKRGQRLSSRTTVAVHLYTPEFRMPRLRLKLRTLALLIVIIALVAAVLVQQRRNAVLRVHLEALE